LARDGRGTPVDYRAAYFHFRFALLQGKEEADHLIKRDMNALGTKLSDQERQVAMAAAEEWFEHHSLKFAFLYKNGASPNNFPAAALTFASDGSFAGQLLPLSSS
jgi:hypothetical protein